MEFIYFFGPLLLVIFVAGFLFRNRTRPGKPSVPRSRAWRDQAAPAHPFSNTVLVAENDTATYAAFAATSSRASDSAAACSDVSGNYSGAGDTGSVCSDTSSTSY